jgi:outer membrane receptor protein involved in Fe transport
MMHCPSHVRHSVRACLLAAILAAAGLPVTLSAQSFTGTISGAIRDSSNSVVPGANVTVTNTRTGQSRASVSGAEGEFIFPALQPGEYRLDAELAGFSKKSITNLVLVVNQRLEVPVVLEIGQLSDTVSVIAEAVLVNTADPTVGQVIEQKRVVDLPLNGRDFVQLATLSAGVETRQTTRGLLATNGTRGNGLSFLFDGVDGNDANAIFLSLTPSIEAVQEFKIQTSTYSAEFGRNAGAQINLVTKSGTNDFNGTVFEFLRDAALDARNYFDPTDQPIPPFTRNQFGGVVGGPVRRNHLFFLVNYEGTRMEKSLTALATVPTEAERAGDFSRTLNPATGALIVVRDPLTGQPFPGNVIPANRLDRIGSRVAALYPLPNRAGTQNFVSSPQQEFDANLLTVRIDHALSSKDTIFGRYFRSESEEFNPFGRVAGAGGTNVPGFAVRIPSLGQNLALNWTRVLSNRLLLEARFGLHRYNTGRFQDQSVDRVSELGILGGHDAPRDNGYPLFQVTGYTAVGDRTDLPQDRPQNTFHYFTNLTYNTGGHNVRTGFEVRYLQEDLYADLNIRGTYTFNPTFTGYGLADLLLGLPTTVSTTVPGLEANWRDTTYGAYVQDDWKVTPQLTLNLGLRYDYFTPITDTQDRRAIFDFADNTIKLVGTNGIPRSGYQADRNNFAPRLGIAYMPFGTARLVTRAGYGIFYDKENWNSHAGLNNQPMFRTSRQYDRPGSISNAFVGPANVPLPNVNAMQSDFRDASYQQWNVFVEGEPLQSTAVGVGYVGSKGSNLPAQRDLNQPTPGVGNAQARRPIPQYAGINYLYSGSSSIFHSLQTRIERRFRAGLSFLATYTLAKTTDDAPLYGGSAPDATNTAAARGPANTDSRHRMSASFIYELPFGPGKPLLSTASGVTGAVLGGWQVNGIITRASGVPFTPTVSQDRAGTARPNSQWPDRLCDGQLDNPTADRWFDASCFAVPAPGTFGNAGRNILVGPGFTNVDLSVFKSFRLLMDHRLQFRLEVFNLFNHVNLGQPNATIDAPLTVGRISTTATDSRQIQLAFKYTF